MSDPRHEYETHLARWRSRTRRYQWLDGVQTWAYVAGFVGVVGVLYLVSERGAVSPQWVALPLGTLALLAAVGAALVRRARRSRRAIAFYERGLARLDGEWRSSGATGEAYVPADHPFAHDLDVVGRGSLFQLLCTARTRAGEAVLARWLVTPPRIEEARTRQKLVQALRARLDLREDLATADPDGADESDAAELAAWGEAPPFLPTSWATMLLASAMPAATAVALFGWGSMGWGPVPFAVAGLAAFVVSRALRPRITAVLAQVRRAHAGLAAVAAVSARIERERFDEPRLEELRAELLSGGRASRRIAALGLRLSFLAALQNDFAQPAAQLFGGATALAFAIERWRLRSGTHVRRWLEAVGAFEALCSLASHAYEHAEDPFAELVEEEAVFDGRGLGHPLLPTATCVCNDVILGHGGPALMLLSGSNMSGKSTLLRTVGTNAVLAYAGAPVRAHRLRVSALAIGASLRVHDSLMEGASRFYAEIVRLRQIVGLLDGAVPVMFLLDEIMHGTNSHDRRQGAEGVLRGLLKGGAIGICTTHDLALAEIVGQIGPRCVNAHLCDDLRGGKLHFDYTLRPGVVRQSNAIELMRAVGLRV